MYHHLLRERGNTGDEDGRFGGVVVVVVGGGGDPGSTAKSLFEMIRDLDLDCCFCRRLRMVNPTNPKATIATRIATMTPLVTAFIDTKLKCSLCDNAITGILTA